MNTYKKVEQIAARLDKLMEVLKRLHIPPLCACDLITQVLIPYYMLTDIDFCDFTKNQVLFKEPKKILEVMNFVDINMTDRIDKIDFLLSAYSIIIRHAAKQQGIN